MKAAPIAALAYVAMPAKVGARSLVQARPTSQVVTLLQDMAEQLEVEGKEDEEVYHTMACWCKTNDQEKTKAITDAEARIADLTSSVESATAASTRLKVEIKSNEADLAGAQSALAEATSIQEKDLAEFTDDEKGLLQSINALDAALVILEKHRGMSASALIDSADQGKDAVAAMGAALDDAALESLADVADVAKSSLLQGKITPHQRAMVAAFAQTKRASLLQNRGALLQKPDRKGALLQKQEPEFAGAQTDAGATTDAEAEQALASPGTNEIFGILEQMRDTFQSNLDSSRKGWTEDKKKFDDLKVAKSGEIKALTQVIADKKGQLADADEDAAVAKEDLLDTENGLSADEKFIIDLKKRCASTDSEWEIRKKMRQEEVLAVNEAISILSSDEAHDNFAKTLSLVQVQQKRSGRANKRTEALRVLESAALATGSAQLTALAASARIDGFVEVKKAIDGMVAELKEAKAEDVKHKDVCTAQLNENRRFTESTEREKADYEAHIASLKSVLGTITTDVKGLEAEIAEMTVQIKRAGEDREAENRDFQQVVADQRTSQRLLTKALDVLKKVYDKKKPAALLAKKAGAAKGEHAAAVSQEPPPPGFKEYKKAGGAGGIVGLIEQILQEAKHMEEEAVRDEQAAQDEYASFLSETNNAVEKKRDSIVNKKQDKADSEQTLTQAQQDLAAENKALLNFGSQAQALHQGCDFVLKNFDLRQQGFAQEVEALQEAKSILSGMDK